MHPSHLAWHFNNFCKYFLIQYSLQNSYDVFEFCKIFLSDRLFSLLKIVFFWLDFIQATCSIILLNFLSRSELVHLSQKFISTLVLYLLEQTYSWLHPKGADLGMSSQYSILFVTYEWANKLECYIKPGWKGLPGTNTLAYWPNLYVT
jgi:hypothetical protein